MFQIKKRMGITKKHLYYLACYGLRIHTHKSKTGITCECFFFSTLNMEGCGIVFQPLRKSSREMLYRPHKYPLTLSEVRKKKNSSRSEAGQTTIKSAHWAQVKLPQVGTTSLLHSMAVRCPTCSNHHLDTLRRLLV